MSTSIVSIDIDTSPTGIAREEARPFLKWTGSKRQLADHIVGALTMRRWSHYHEPMLGGGSVYFALRARCPWPFDATLSESNERLIRTFRAVQSSVEGVVGVLSPLEYDRATFDDVRGWLVDGLSDTLCAAWLIYLNRTCFNGLYRVNKRGRFNVPFGDYSNPTICDASNLRACSRALRDAELRCRDVVESLALVRGPEHAAYVDPPYVPASKTANFASYTTLRFAAAQQEALRDAAEEAGRSGAHVVLSNSDTEIARDLYTEARGFQCERVEVRRSIGCKASTRGAAGELVIRYEGTS